jgi:hypothetical protein
MSAGTFPFDGSIQRPALAGSENGSEVLDEAGLLVVNPSLPGDLRIGRFEIGRREVKLPVCTGQ